jgi:hypothetical protein
MRVIAAAVILLALGIGFGTPAADVAKMRVFADAVERWQHDPDFRKAQVEYCELGSDAMRVKVCFVSGTDAIMFLRSLPGLPKHLAVNPTSQAHYDSFTAGPLSSYLRVSDEQGTAGIIPKVEELGAMAPVSDDDVRKFLGGFQLNAPIVRDAGAVRSVRSLLNDTDAGRKFAVRDKVPDRLLAPIASIAAELGYPGDCKQMTVAQQAEVWKRLDDHVRQTDYELWRAKQVNDFLNGVWAQGYGPDYLRAIDGVLMARDVCRVAAPVALMLWVGVALYRRRRANAAGSPVANDLAEGRLALEGGEEVSAQE